MNYRHAFHAGNHADVLKHVLLTRVLHQMVQKDKSMAVLDAHAGIGRYNLMGVEAFKAGEWHDGIARLIAAKASDADAALLAPYKSIIATLNPDRQLRIYPGSPEIALRLLRPIDRLVLNELHPADGDTLAARYGQHPKVQVTRVDATQAVKAELPFRERRGLVLIDPAFEERDETERVFRMVRHALKRQVSAVVMVWYPIKADPEAATFRAMFLEEAGNGILSCELRVREAFKEGGLAGSGVLVFNPPFTLHDEAKQFLPFLAGAMGLGEWGRGDVTWIKPPR